MIDTQILLFLAAACAIALSPGPGMLYVAARALSDGRRAGMASSLGTGLGGLVHVAGGAIGVSALLMASAEAFTVLKLVGALYLVHLGIKAWREAGAELALDGGLAQGRHRAFTDGVVVEALNPKTAAFFLAFVPQFIDPAATGAAGRFMALGTISVALNTAVDVVVAWGAASMRARLAARPVLVRRLRRGSAGVLCGLGVSLLLARRSG